MFSHRLAPLLFGAPLLLAATPAAAQIPDSADASSNAATTVVIADTNVVTMDDAGTVLAGASVVIAHGRIARIVPAGGAVPSAGVTRIDGHGGWLIPGLIDGHTHYDQDYQLALYLRSGVTTTVSLGRPAEAMKPFPHIQAEIAAGRFPGPTVYATGPIISNSIQIDTPDQARAFVDEEARTGYGFVKVYNGTSRVVFDAVVAETRHQGMGVFGHMPRDIDPEYVVSNGLNVLAHMEELFFTALKAPRDRDLDSLTPDWRPDTSRIDAIFDEMKAHDVVIIPNLVASYGFAQLWVDPRSILAGPEIGQLDDETATGWRTGNFTHRPDVMKRILREQLKLPLLFQLTWRAHQKGVLLVAGTDSPIPPIFPGTSLHEELRLLVMAGLTPKEALATATRNAGEMIRRYVDRKACIGVVRAGCEADLVLLSADPLGDIRATEAIVGVMSDGRWRNRAELDRLAPAPGEPRTP
jgi:imidazolonepropionase-like amidohydrolase